MKTRFIMVVLDAAKMEQESKTQERAMKERAGNAAILIEGAFTRAGQVFELHDVPKMGRGDMIVFTGRYGDDHRERRVRMHVNAALYNMATDEWFMVVVAVVPRSEHWNYDGVTAVAKASRRNTDIDLMLESAKDSPVIHAVFCGWEAYQQAMPPFGVMVLGRGCGNPECKECHGDEDGSPDSPE